MNECIDEWTDASIKQKSEQIENNNKKIEMYQYINSKFEHETFFFSSFFTWTSILFYFIIEEEEEEENIKALAVLFWS